MTKDLVVRRIDDRSEVKRIPLDADASPNRVERTLMGLLRNMDNEQFYVDDSAFDEAPTSEMISSCASVVLAVDFSWSTPKNTTGENTDV